MKTFVTTLLVTLTLSFATTAVQAQDRAARRELVEDLLRGLIEAQMNKNRQPQHDHDHNGNAVRPGQRPPSQPRVVVETSPQMVKVRGHLKNWNSTCHDLIDEIRHHEHESPKLRPLLADALKVQANIELLNRKAQLYPTVEPLVADFQIVDADWRMLSYRLKNSGALSSECSTFINSINNLDKQMCGLMNVQPQVNRRELMRLAGKLSSDYDHLLHDVYYVARHAKGGRELMIRGKNLQSMMHQSVSLLSRGDYETIVEAYTQCIGEWKAFSGQLHKFRDERLRRSIADIETTGRLISEQLWLPVQVDRNYLANIVSTVARDAGSVFDSVTLTQLLGHRTPGGALGAAREFNIACENFNNSIKSNKSLEQLAFDFRDFEGRWQAVHRLYHDFGVESVDDRLEEIEFAMVTLKETFGEAPAMDYAQLVQLTADLDAYCRQTAHDVHKRIVQPRYNNEFHAEICESADRLASSVNVLHRNVLQNPRVQLTRADFNDMFRSYNAFKPMLKKCKSQDKLVLARLLSQIEPLMVKLQVVYN